LGEWRPGEPGNTVTFPSAARGWVDAPSLQGVPEMKHTIQRIWRTAVALAPLAAFALALIAQKRW